MYSQLAISIKLFLVTLLLFVMGCDELLEDDISDVTIDLVGPGDQVQVDTSYVNLVWEEILDRDLAYQVRLVEGESFENPSMIVMDSVVSSKSVSTTLDTGRYFWGVRAVNEYQRSSFITRSFDVVNANPQLGQVTLIFPRNDQTLQDTLFQFSWTEVPNASEYVWTVDELPELNTVTNETFLLRAFPAIEESYHWKVRAILENSNLFIESPTYVVNIEPRDNIVQ